MSEFHNISTKLTVTARTYMGNPKCWDFALRCSCGYRCVISDFNNRDTGVLALQDIIDKHKLLVVCEKLDLRFPVTTVCEWEDED